MGDGSGGGCPTEMGKGVLVAVEKLWEEVRELSLGTSFQVERLECSPSPVQFLRDFVSVKKPCIISNATLHWPALTSWSDEAYLSRALSQSVVSVHLTPNGLADALVPLPSNNSNDNNHPHPPEMQTQEPSSSSSLCFASAHVERMPFPLALQHISSSSSSKPFVAYAQQQNDCFRSEYSAVAHDVESHIPWATQAIGCFPEAVNVWIGNHLSQTSFHKDHYDNLYAVISGEKHFLLLPPTDVHRMYIRHYPVAHYSFSHDTGEFTLELDNPSTYVPWCSVDPYPPPVAMEAEMLSFPLYFNGPKPFHCTIKAGEILYLPSMWFHHVRQSPNDRGYAIAINYWYDMQFDIKYAYFNFLQSINLASLCDSSSCWKDHDNDSELHEVNVKVRGAINTL